MTSDQAASALLSNAVALISGAAGVMLAFLWGTVSSRTATGGGIQYVRMASVLLLVSIVMSLLTLQLAIARTRQNQSVASSLAVAVAFGVSWIAFVAGSVLLTLAVFGA